MNRILLGVVLGLSWGAVDVLITMRHGNLPRESLLQAFSSRFALGFLGAIAHLPWHPVWTGILVGILVSLPDAFGLRNYGGILGTGVLFGALTGLAVKLWAR